MVFKHYVIHVLQILFAINILFASQSCNFFYSYLPIWFSLLKAICYPRDIHLQKLVFSFLSHTMAGTTNKSCYAKHSFNRLPHHRMGEMASTRCCLLLAGFGNQANYSSVEWLKTYPAVYRKKREKTYFLKIMYSISYVLVVPFLHSYTHT